MVYDIIVVGGGPAGLTAALYARRAGRSVLVIEKGAFGGQITFSPKVENIPGFFSVTGNEFAEKLVGQVLEQGAEVESAEVLSILDGECKTVVTDGGDFVGRAVIVAAGTRHRLLGLAGEESFIGNGISFCAVCDGAFYQGQTVGVVGGGNSALQEALLLSEGLHQARRHRLHEYHHDVAAARFAHGSHFTAHHAAAVHRSRYAQRLAGKTHCLGIGHEMQVAVLLAHVVESTGKEVEGGIDAELVEKRVVAIVCLADFNGVVAHTAPDAEEAEEHHTY